MITVEISPASSLSPAILMRSRAISNVNFTLSPHCSLPPGSTCARTRAQPPLNPLGQKTQTCHFPTLYRPPTARSSSCIPSRYGPYSPPMRGTTLGDMNHDLLPTADAESEICD